MSFPKVLYLFLFIDSPDYKLNQNKETKIATTNVTEEKDSEFVMHDFEAGGNFIDDDFGLSLQQESEHIRQQQLLIEQEVNIEKKNFEK